MAKVRGPLLSLHAKGSIYENLTFSARATGQQVRSQRKQADVITPARTAHRQTFIAAKTAWHELSPAAKEEYNRATRGKTMTGYNLYLKNYLLTPPPEFPAALFGIGIFGQSIYGKN